MSPYDFNRALVAVDGSEGSETALDCAISICQAVDATLTALAVEGKLPAYAASRPALTAAEDREDAGVLAYSPSRSLRNQHIAPDTQAAPARAPVGHQHLLRRPRPPHLRAA